MGLEVAVDLETAPATVYGLGVGRWRHPSVEEEDVEVTVLPAVQPPVEIGPVLRRLARHTSVTANLGVRASYRRWRRGPTAL